MPDFPLARARMVETQLARRHIRDESVLAAMGEVPREAFVEKGAEEFAYDDAALPIAENQTISQPYIVALMLEAARLEAGDHVLEVGAGSGYAAAVASRIAARVYTIERHGALADAARARFARLGYRNIELRHGDGAKGWPEAAPFDAILVAAASAEVPPALKQQLAIGGRLIMPTGASDREQTLKRIIRTGEASYDEDELLAVRFVPLVSRL